MNPYNDILKTLADAGVEFIVGGGVACVLHGVERVTMDVDVSVHMQPYNLGKFIEVMHTLGLKPRVPVAPQVLMDPVFVRIMIEEKHALVFSFLDPDQPIRQVDVFLKADLAYETLLPDSQWVEMKGYRVRIINRARLLAIKRAIQPQRVKDALDIEYLSRNET
jgi:predicted nucleotidyltransferase